MDPEECQNTHACEAAGLEAENVLGAMEGMGCQNGEVENMNETMNDLTWRKESFFEQGSANGIFDERENEISWWPESESVNDLFRPQDVFIS